MDPETFEEQKHAFLSWFSLVTAKGQLTAQCYSCLEQLVANHVTAFLTKLELAAYKLNDGKDALHKDAGLSRRRLQYAKTTLGAGQVVRLVGVFEDVHRARAPQRRLSLASLGRAQAPAKYAQCVNHKNQIVFIPLSTTGQFYAVSCGPDEPDDLRMLYQVPQLLADYRLPLKVHLVSGALPAPRPQAFTA
ncbi:uncharacterized protein LOC134528520 [Bacillus rossius redtenbacheri]|uniref:uncharacterized protein LOC134528520 n=1 Tax=Bacillus rossius redtenbacheri TaxID=93214 RepID=UPI002FDD12DB